MTHRIAITQAVADKVRRFAAGRLSVASICARTGLRTAEVRSVLAGDYLPVAPDPSVVVALTPGDLAKRKQRYGAARSAAMGEREFQACRRLDWKRGKPMRTRAEHHHIVAMVFGPGHEGERDADAATRAARQSKEGENQP